MIKKKCIAGVVLAALLLTAVPVSAKNLTDVQPSGDTDVTGVVSGQNPGGVTYTIAIPDTIDFGTLSQPSDDKDSHFKDVGFEVTATEINNLQPNTFVAVLMKDVEASETDMGFRISGQDNVNSGKSLYYDVYAYPSEDIKDSVIPINGTVEHPTHAYPNGYAFTFFQEPGTTVSGTLRLNQNQLYMQNLTQWAGNYKGTIRFFSTIASPKDVN